MREDFSRSRCDSLIIDIKSVTENLKKMDAAHVELHMAHSGKQHQARGGKRRQARGHYKDSKKHSLAKHGKTHPIC